jgi:hypothetical protein
MKSAARFSSWIALIALLCFASCAFGQGRVSDTVTNAGNHALNAPASFLTFTPDRGGRDGDHWGGGKGCGNQGGGGGEWGGGSWDAEERDDGGWGGGGGNRGGGCTSVPEGGTALMYLSLAGLSCMGAMALRSRRRASVGETN